MNRTILFTLLLFVNNVFGQKNTPITDKQAFTIGETIEIHSKVLNENRTLNIYLPDGYNPDSLKKYPVIYLLDGSRDEDFIHIAGLVQFCSFPWVNIIPESIVVGISNVDRKRDFTFPTNNKKDKTDYPTTGGSENFINFIEKELQPFIEKNYKTTSSKTIIGQSLGGLLATEILFKKPNLFNNYIIISPSLWWDDESLLKYEIKPLSAETNIYIAVGKEGKVMERTAKELSNKVKLANTKNLKLFFEFFDGQNHANILHLAVYNAFEKLFKK